MRTAAFLDWTETLLCNSLPMPHCSQQEWDELIHQWRKEKHARRKGWLARLLAGFAIGLLLSSCTAARRTTISPEGEVEIVNGGQQGGRYTVVYTRSKSGAVKYAENIDNEKSHADTMQTVGIGYGGHVLAGVEKAKDAGDAAVALGAQNAGVKTAKIAADEAVALGAQGVETTAILKPPVP